jgi:hypothetical protein
MQEMIVDDYFVDPPAKRVIPLDPALSAQDNAKKYFKQYRKGKLSKAYAEGQSKGLPPRLLISKGSWRILKSAICSMNSAKLKKN